MSLSLYSLASGRDHHDIKPGAFKKWLSRFWHSFEASRMRRARIESLRVLQTLDDETLQRGGFSNQDITEIRAGHPVSRHL